MDRSGSLSQVLLTKNQHGSHTARYPYDTHRPSTPRMTHLLTFLFYSISLVEEDIVDHDTLDLCLKDLPSVFSNPHPPRPHRTQHDQENASPPPPPPISSTEESRNLTIQSKKFGSTRFRIPVSKTLQTVRVGGRTETER